jgi:hypothetical protein
MLVAEVTLADRRKTRYKIESRDDVPKGRQEYEIKPVNEKVVRLSEDGVESISVVDA